MRWAGCVVVFLLQNEFAVPAFFPVDGQTSVDTMQKTGKEPALTEDHPMSKPVDVSDIRTIVTDAVAVAFNNASRVFTENRAAEMLTEQFPNNAVLSAINAANAELLQQISSLREEVQFLRAQQDQLVTSAISRFIPAGPFMHRCYAEHRDDKWAVALFVSDLLFSKETRAVRCFVQASSTAHHLGWALAHHYMPPGSLVYTNSIVMPLPLLWGYATGRPTVFAFCGWKFSPNCAGWTIPKYDEVSFDSLKDQFALTNKDRLWRTCVSPMFVTPDTGIWYEEEENSLLSECMTDADEIIVMVPGSRIIPNATSLPKDRPYYPALQRLWLESPSKFWVIASQHDQSPPADLIAQLTNRGVRVSWNSRDGWQGERC